MRINSSATLLSLCSICLSSGTTMNCEILVSTSHSLRGLSTTYVGNVHEQIEDTDGDHGEERRPLVVLLWILNFAQNLIW